MKKWPISKRLELEIGQQFDCDGFAERNTVSKGSFKPCQICSDSQELNLDEFVNNNYKHQFILHSYIQIGHHRIDF